LPVSGLAGANKSVRTVRSSRTNYKRPRPVFSVRASSDSENTVESSSSSMAPASEVSAAAVKSTEPFAMNFNGFAPETINGRLAQIGFIAGVGAEIGSGESFAYQFQNHPIAFGFACALITAASFMPSMQKAKDYTSNPKTVPNQGLFSVDAEKLNGRAAMLGIVAILGTEYFKGGALF